MNRPGPVASGRLRERLALIMSAGSLMTLTAVHAEAQTLDVYLRAGRTVSVQGRLAELTDDEADARLAVARARLLPSFTATGSYRRNQYEAVATIPDGEGGFQTGTFTPYDQLEATLVIDVPLFDLTAIRSLAAARRGRTAGEASRELALLEVDRAVARAFYDAVATAELHASAERSAEVAAENLTVIEARVRAGLSSELELERARAEAARSRERVSDAARLRAEAQRRLRVLTDLAAPPAGETAPPDLDDDGTLERVSFNGSCIGVALGANEPYTVTWELTKNGVAIESTSEEVFVEGASNLYVRHISLEARDVAVSNGDVIGARLSCSPVAMEMFRAPHGIAPGGLAIHGGSFP